MFGTNFLYALKMFSGKTSLPVSHGSLEAIYRPTRTDASHIALLLHPHPVYGGSMHNPVVFHCAKALETAGYETLRFNFRGVGESTGLFDEGRGEYEDAAAALAFLCAAQPQAREVLVAGYSFGAAIGLRLAATEPAITRAVGLATPAALLRTADLKRCLVPKLFLHGDADELAPLDALRAMLGTSIPEPFTLKVIPGASHFFEEDTDTLIDALVRWGTPTIEPGL